MTKFQKNSWTRCLSSIDQVIFCGSKILSELFLNSTMAIKLNKVYFRLLLLKIQNRQSFCVPTMRYPVGCPDPTSATLFFSSSNTSLITGRHGAMLVAPSLKSNQQHLYIYALLVLGPWWWLFLCIKETKVLCLLVIV